MTAVPASAASGHTSAPSGPTMPAAVPATGATGSVVHGFAVVPTSGVGGGAGVANPHRPADPRTLHHGAAGPPRAYGHPSYHATSAAPTSGYVAAPRVLASYTARVSSRYRDGGWGRVAVVGS